MSWIRPFRERTEIGLWFGLTVIAIDLGSPKLFDAQHWYYERGSGCAVTLFGLTFFFMMYDAQWIEHILKHPEQL